MITKYKINEDLDFLSINNMSQNDMTELSRDYKLTSEIIEYATDMKERPRTEYIEELKSWLVIFQVISNSDHINKIALPITLLLSNNQIILFTTDKTLYVEEYFNKLSKKDSKNNKSSWGIFFEFSDKISEVFIDKIEDISDKRSIIQKRLAKRKISDKEILQLSITQEEISYLLTAVNGDYLFLKDAQLLVEGSELKTNFNKEDLEVVKDAVIEFEQIQRMTELLSDITDKLSNSFNNLLNNQTNGTMKILTIYSLILSIPTIISGFYGMNMFLPVANKPWSWIFSLALVFIGVGIILIDLKRRHFL